MKGAIIGIILMAIAVYYFHQVDGIKLGLMYTGLALIISYLGYSAYKIDKAVPDDGMFD